MQSLVEEIASSLPGRLKLPAEFAWALNWMESVGAFGRMGNGQVYGVTDPGYVNSQGSCGVYFHAADPAVVRAWTGSNAEDLDRVAPIVCTGGDGSMAALWIDDDGEARVVHMGSGSGSVSVGTMTRSPLDFLRLLAVGYDEICWPDSYDMMPIDACYDRAGYRPPTKFRSWLTETFGVSIPDKAASLVLPMADIGAPSDDPFCCWLNARTG